MTSSHDYLLIGGGMAAAAAARGIRAVDRTGSIALIGREPDRPYNRPPLSKALWRGEPLATIWRDSDLEGVELLLGRNAVLLDPARHRVRDAEGREYGFRKLLLATGGTPRRLPLQGPGGSSSAGAAGERVIHFRTLRDYERLRALAVPGARCVVIGGGFIGAEIAAALATNGVQVTLVFPEDGVCARVLPAELSGHVTGLFREKGVQVLAHELVATIEEAGAGVLVRTRGGKELEAEVVVAGLGIVPEVSLAKEAGLFTEDGILVDASLRTSHPDVYAAGDVASFPDLVLGGRRRVEHEDNANAMGELAGRAMAGETVAYQHQPFFYSDLFELGYEAVGEVDARLDTVADWREPLREGTLYYSRAGRVRGVLLWNSFGRVDEARALIAAGGEVRPAELHGRV